MRYPGYEPFRESDLPMLRLSLLLLKFTGFSPGVRKLPPLDIHLDAMF